MSDKTLLEKFISCRGITLAPPFSREDAIERGVFLTLDNSTQYTKPFHRVPGGRRAVPLRQSQNRGY